MISVGDLVVFTFAVTIVVTFFYLLRRAIRKADQSESSEDHD